MPPFRTPCVVVVATAALAAALAACAEAGDAPPFAPGEASPIHAGLWATERLHHTGSANQGPHLSEMAVFGDHVYVANSGDSVTAYRLEVAGGLSQTHDALTNTRDMACQFLAVHAPSKSLFCAALLDGGLKVLDLSDPSRPVPRALAPPDIAAAAYWRDLAVVGDALFVAASDGGLLRGAIGPQGEVAVLAKTGVGGHVVQVVGDGGALALLDTDLGLVFVDPAAAPPTVLATHAVTGPLVDLALDERPPGGARAAVALGSEGAAVFGFDPVGGELAPLAQLQPHCVVTGVALRGDLLALACTTGIHLYDLAPPAPRLVGFEASLGVMLDVSFAGPAGDSVVVTDWEWVTRLSFDVTGDAVLLDRPRGYHVRPGDGAVVALRNPGGAPLHAWLEARVGPEGPLKVLGSAVVAPGETVGLPLSAAVVARHLGSDGIARIGVRTLEAAGLPAVSNHHRDQVNVAVRDPAADPAMGHPATGDPFPWMRLGALPSGTEELPRVGLRQRFVFYGEDCSGMWGEVLDVDWLAAQGRPPEGLTPTLVTHNGRDQLAEFARQLRLGGADTFSSAGPDSAMRTLAAPEGEYIGDDIYNARFWLGAIPGGANHPTDYLVGADGIVERVDRVYRGAWPLVPDRVIGP